MSHIPTNPWVALVTFEKSLADDSYPDTLNVLQGDFLGASGWMAVDAPSEQFAKSQLTTSFDEAGLKLVEIEDLQRVCSLEQYRDFDDHLGKNVMCWEAGKLTVWGIIHCYYAEGQA